MSKSKLLLYELEEGDWNTKDIKIKKLSLP